MNALSLARRRSVWVVVAAAAIGLGSLQFIGQRDASADEAPQVLRASTQPSTEHVQTLRFTCPKGKHAVGVTGTIDNPGGGHAYLSKMWPSGTHAYVVATAEGDVAANWSVSGTVNCVTRSTLPNLTSVQVSGTPTAGQNANLEAKCPAGKVLVGGGWQTTGAARFDSMYPGYFDTTKQEGRETDDAGNVIALTYGSRLVDLAPGDSGSLTGIAWCARGLTAKPGAESNHDQQPGVMYSKTSCTSGSPYLAWFGGHNWAGGDNANYPNAPARTPADFLRMGYPVEQSYDGTTVTNRLGYYPEERHNYGMTAGLICVKA